MVDVNGCTSTSSINVPQPDPLAVSATVISDYNGQDVSCNGANDGRASANVTGGTLPVTYLWSEGSTGNIADNLSAGTYTVTATDVNGCTISNTVVITEPLPMNIAINKIDVSCNGDNSGSINITLSGGVPPYNFVWSNGSTDEDQNTLLAGTYTVTVSDANSCTSLQTIIINEPPAILVTDSLNTPSCAGGADGSIDIDVSGGVVPYTYLWSTGATTEDLSSVTAGTYNLTINDANGCVSNNVFVVTDPVNMNLSVSVTDISCTGVTSDGQIDLIVSGAIPPLSYIWSDGSTTEDIDSLSAGNYTVTVTDGNGCTSTLTTAINSPPALSLSANITHIACNGNTNGAIDLVVSGGVPPYSYSWSNGSTTEDILGLTGGTFTITVTDANSCSNTAAFTVNQPPPLNASISITAISCNGGNNGVVSVTAGGGVPPYSYNWSIGSTNQVINSLSAGTYTLTITDANSCTRLEVINVAEPAALSLSSNNTNVSCNGLLDGTIDLTITGGVGPYTQVWSNGSTMEDITSIGAGTYSVTVTDQNGCTSILSTSINEPAALVLNIVPTHVTTNGGSDGTANAVMSGGTPAYTYLWSTGQTTQNIGGLSSGTYTVTVTDANGCTIQDLVIIQEPNCITVSLSLSQVDVTCNGLSNGSATAFMVNGINPVSYIWSDGQTTQSATGLSAGTYTVTVTDAVSCVVTGSVIITEPPLLVLTGVDNDISCFGANDASIDITITGGVAPYIYNWSSGQTTEDLASLGAGMYTLTVTDDNGCNATMSFTITEPSALTASTVVSNVLCNGQSNGIIDLTVSGGILPYTYVWSNGYTTQDVGGMTAGTYTSYCYRRKRLYGSSDFSC